MAKDAAPAIPCRSEPCKYHGFWQLREWCRHPDHTEPLEQRHELAQVAAGRCRDHVNWEAKVMPGTEPRWPMPVDLAALFQPSDQSDRSETSDWSEGSPQ